MFLSIPGLTGPSTVTGFQGQYPVSAFSQSAVQTLSIGTGSSGTGAEKVTFEPISITISNDYTIPDLFLALCTGSDLCTEKNGNFVVLSIAESSPSGSGLSTLMTLTMDVVAVQSLNFTSDYQNVTLELAYGKLAVKTWQFGATGVVTNWTQAGWDRIRNVNWNGVSAGT
jgi:type VI protein secretion system component Hcp